MLLTGLWLGCELVLLLAVLALPAAIIALYLDPAVRRSLALARAFPQPRAAPVIGHLLHFVAKPVDELFRALRVWRRELGSRYVLTLFGWSFFTISDPQAVEVVLSSSKHTTKGLMYDLLVPWLGRGLLTSRGRLWQSRRKLLTPAFHFRILDQFSEHLEQHAQCLVDELLRTTAASGDPVDVVPTISRITLRAICVTAMGKVDFQTDANSSDLTSEKEYFDAVLRVGTAVLHRLVRPWLWWGTAYKMTDAYKQFRKDIRTLHDYTTKVIAERKKLLTEALDGSPAAADEGVRNNKSRLQPFLDVLISAQRDGADLTDRNIREEVDTFMFEGHDTTAMALSWALELLGRHPEVQDRLADELSHAAADWESVSRLPYLDRVIKECLRLRPSVPFISRLLESEAVLSDTQILPARSVVQISIYDLHRHPDFFPDPERFDEDRFLPEREAARHPFAYIPFSAGPRNCVGKRFAVMELKLMFAAVVRHFKIRSGMTDVSDSDLFICDLVLRPRTGVYLQLTPRTIRAWRCSRCRHSFLLRQIASPDVDASLCHLLSSGPGQPRQPPSRRPAGVASDSSAEKNKTRSAQPVGPIFGNSIALRYVRTHRCGRVWVACHLGGLAMLLIVLSVVAALVWSCFRVLKSSYVLSKIRDTFPPPSGNLPIIGHAGEYWGDEEHIFKTIRKFYKERGNRFCVKVMSELAINIFDAEGVEAVMTNSKAIKKGPLYDFLLQWLGRGLLTNFGPSWHHRRKLLTPAFHFKILDEFGPMIQQHSARLVHDLAGLVQTTKGPVDVVLPVSKVTLGTICETAMGVDLQALGKEDEYFESVRKVGQSVAYRLTRPWTWRDLVFNLTPFGRKMRKDLKKLHDFTRQIIQERKNSHHTTTLKGEGQTLRKRRLAFLDMMLVAQREDPTLTDDDIREEVDTFMFEGHETTAMAISWALFSLGNHPDIQERVREEVVAAGDDWQAVNSLPYLEMVIKESLRLYPPVMFISRANENDFQIGDVKIPAGVSLDLVIFLIHRNPVHFPDPERFDPERFSPEQERGRHPFAYVPFSGGLRNCIGRRFAMMELKLMVAAVVRAFSFRSEVSEQEIEYRPELVLRPKQGIKLHVTPLS